MTLIQLIKKHKSAKTFEAGFQEAKQACDATAFYQADAEGNTAFHHLVFEMNAGLPEQDAVLMLYYLIGIDQAVRFEKLNINAKNNNDVTALDLAFSHGRFNFSKAMSIMDCVNADPAMVDVFYSTPYAALNKKIQTASSFFQPVTQAPSESVSPGQRSPSPKPQY